MSMPTFSRTCATYSAISCDALVGELDAGEHVLRIGASRSAPLPSGMVSAPGTSRHQVDAEVHLQPGEALRRGAPSAAAP